MTQNGALQNNHNKSWVERLTQFFSGEPRNKQELLALLKEAAVGNIIDNEALSIIEGAIKVADMQVRDIMIPRAQTIMIQVDSNPEEFLPTIIESAHSRFPVITDNVDEVIGILLAKDLLQLALNTDNQAKFNFRDLLRPAIFVPESKRLNILLREFKSTRNHMAIVVDEYGNLAGIVTIEDVLEQIVGDIEDEHDQEDESNIKKINRTDYVIKAMTSIEDFNEVFKTEFYSDVFDTVGGMVIKEFGYLPTRNEMIQIDKYQFKVLSADSRRVKLLRVSLRKS